MLKRLLLTAMAATLAVTMVHADQAKTKVTIPVSRVTPTSGKQMYVNYCAPCHGVDGRGHGSVASALRTPPPDLTMLTRFNHGRFPDFHVVAVLQFGPEIPSHGAAEMPVWGPILAKMNQANPQDRLLRIANLSRYLDAIQAK
jgi:mono/diheme cytochrome c family protein